MKPKFNMDGIANGLCASTLGSVEPIDYPLGQ